MPRSKASRGSNQDPIEKIPFKFFSFSNSTSTSLAAPTIVTVNLSPAFESRLSAIAEVFQFYRFSQLKVSLLPNINEVTADDTAVSAGYIPRVPNAAPTTHNQILGLPGSTYKGLGQTMPASFRLGKNVLIADAPLKWFQSVAGTEDTQWEIQGVLYLGGTGTNNPTTFTYMIEGVCEFKGRSNASLTPLYPLIGSKKSDSVNSSDTPGNVSQEIIVGGQKFKMVSA